MVSILNSLKCIQNTDIDPLNANIDLKISKAFFKYFKKFYHYKLYIVQKIWLQYKGNEKFCTKKLLKKISLKQLDSEILIQ